MVRERRRTTASSGSYTGFRAVESFQYPSQWKKAAQSVGTLLLVSGAGVLACCIYRLATHGIDCSATCTDRTITDIAAVAISALDVLLHLLLLVSLKRGWAAITIGVVVWAALRSAAAIYLLVQSTYWLHTIGARALVMDHYVAQVVLVIAQAVVLYTLGSAAHEQRTQNQMDDDGLP